ncbi:hypothetical protein ACERJO_11695 [Halalkalibacter sp. AB-rgal2]|uniref:hypothetical protein n=1 Tax=Halalkalibacter sp. AB-rgal2 TaxID=3242695 RepID=UPI00359EFB94
MDKIHKLNESNEINEALLLQHDIEHFEKLEETKEKYRKIVNAGISQWVKDFQNGNIQVNTVEDLKKLVELDLQLQREEY